MQENTQPSSEATPSGFIHRWYDVDLQVSEMVAALEGMTEESKHLFGFLLCFLCDELIKTKDRSAFMSELDWNKLVGLMKSKRSRRWYDHEPVLHKAFNLLYSLNDDDKILIGRELCAPSQLVREYETRCQDKQKTPDVNIVFEIVESVFTEGPNKAHERFSALPEA